MWFLRGLLCGLLVSCLTMLCIDGEVLLLLLTVAAALISMFATIDTICGYIHDLKEEE